MCIRDSDKILTKKETIDKTDVYFFGTDTVPKNIKKLLQDTPKVGGVGYFAQFWRTQQEAVVAVVERYITDYYGEDITERLKELHAQNITSKMNNVYAQFVGTLKKEPSQTKFTKDIIPEFNTKANFFRCAFCSKADEWRV